MIYLKIMVNLMQSKHLLHFRRRREGKTNYKKRLNLLMSGTPRMVVRRTNRKTIVQIVESDHGEDKTVAAVDSSFLAGSGWKNSMSSIPSAYLTGLMLAKIAKSKKIDKAILDIGLLTPTKGAKVFAVLKGAVDGGLDIPHSDGSIPSDERISGVHIDSYMKTTVGKDFEVFKKNILEGKISIDAPKPKPSKKKEVKTKSIDAPKPKPSKKKEVKTKSK